MTTSIAVTDMDNDGHPDFIVFGNGLQKNQLLMDVVGDGVSPVREPGWFARQFLVTRLL